MEGAKHTIVLLQPGGKPTRTFHDYETVSHAMNGIIQIFEKQLKELNPTMRNITYDINDLYAYIDSMPDLSCLVFDHGTSQYQPYTKEWIKKRVYQLLKKQAT